MRWVLAFSIIATVAAVLGVMGIPAIASEIPWYVFIVSFVLAIVFFVLRFGAP